MKDIWRAETMGKKTVFCLAEKKAEKMVELKAVEWVEKMGA